MRALLVRNHRGREVPAVLGFVLASSGAVGAAVVAWVRGPVRAVGWIGAGGALVVFAAGLADDLVPSPARGLRQHLRQLGSGRVTTGTVKLVVIVAVSVIVVASGTQLAGWSDLAGVLLIAGSTNLANGLDVTQGRAIKFGLPLGLVALAGCSAASVPAVPGVLAGAAIALPFDLRERAMLGDAGSNLLGFSVGLAAYRAMPIWGTWLCAAVVLTLNVVADTYTLSRLTMRFRPLRWYEGLGRIA